jgi:hypothetical protein
MVRNALRLAKLHKLLAIDVRNDRRKSGTEYDFGFMTVKAMRALGLVKASRTGVEIPGEVPLASLNF